MTAQCSHGYKVCPGCYAEMRERITAAETAVKPNRYDIQTDSMKPVTQEDWDELHNYLLSMQKQNQAMRVADADSSKPWKFQLAVFPNPRQLGRAWIAEAKEIEPYDALRFGGELLYPPTPNTPWVVGQAIDQDFALEIVRRWNRVPGQY